MVPQNKMCASPIIHFAIFPFQIANNGKKAYRQAFLDENFVSPRKQLKCLLKSVVMISVIQCNYNVAWKTFYYLSYMPTLLTIIKMFKKVLPQAFMNENIVSPRKQLKSLLKAAVMIFVIKCKIVLPEKRFTIFLICLNCFLL